MSILCEMNGKQYRKQFNDRVDERLSNIPLNELYWKRFKSCNAYYAQYDGLEIFKSYNTIVAIYNLYTKEIIIRDWKKYCSEFYGNGATTTQQIYKWIKERCSDWRFIAYGYKRSDKVVYIGQCGIIKERKDYCYIE